MVHEDLHGFSLDEIQSNYKEEKNWMELQFTLPKGCYATELIRELIH